MIDTTNIDPDSREEIIRLYFSDYKTTIRISRMTGISLPVVRAVVKLHHKKLTLGDKREYESKPIAKRRSTKTGRKSKPVHSQASGEKDKCTCSESELCGFHQSLLDKSRDKDKIKCPIFQYV